MHWMEGTASQRAAQRPRGEGAAVRVPSVGRALMLLDRLAERREPMTLARLATDLALPKSSVHGLCSTLLSFGYLRRRDDGAFLIGPRVMGLAEAFVHGTHVAEEFNTLWKERGSAPDETVLLSVLSGAEVVYVAARNGVRPLGLAFNVGMRLPAHLSATGRAMLAWRDPAFVRRLFPADELPRMSGKGPRTVDDLLKNLAATRRRGYSVDDESVREGVYCIGAPVFDATGQPVAGVGVCINKAMLGGDQGKRQREVVLHAAQALSQRLGGTWPLSTPTQRAEGR